MPNFFRSFVFCEKLQKNIPRSIHISVHSKLAFRFWTSEDFVASKLYMKVTTLAAGLTSICFINNNDFHPWVFSALVEQSFAKPIMHATKSTSSGQSCFVYFSWFSTPSYLIQTVEARWWCNSDIVQMPLCDGNHRPDYESSFACIALPSTCSIDYCIEGEAHWPWNGKEIKSLTKSFDATYVFVAKSKCTARRTIPCCKEGLNTTWIQCNDICLVRDHCLCCSTAVAWNNPSLVHCSQLSCPRMSSKGSAAFSGVLPQALG